MHKCINIINHKQVTPLTTVRHGGGSIVLWRFTLYCMYVSIHVYVHKHNQMYLSDVLFDNSDLKVLNKGNSTSNISIPIIL